MVVEHQRWQALTVLAESLLVTPEPFRQLVEQREQPLDLEFVLDVVAALAYCQGVDPQWLLTGRYDSSIHRFVLSLGEERSARGLRRVRDFVQEQYHRLRRDTPPFLLFPDRKPSSVSD